jgi:phosphopantetheinyl transferase (holo-ACP synthase)
VKEAFLKALGTGVLGSIALEHIEVELDGRAASLRLGASAEAALSARGASRTWVSTADDGRFAWAAVVVGD